MAKGHLFCITSGTSVDFYEVDYVVSNTELYLVQAYRGTTATGKAYEIITTFSDSVPEFARRLTATLSAYQQQSDAFQALLTSTATTVEVTAPDGTKQTLIPWKRVTSEGEGQAARAKTEADKAAASAALAGDIVAASALPLPDVWAPLSDSLRLITGYGRDVLVGSDVVARMVNFSRSSTATYIGKDGLLKTAAVNEPRFEKDGLLVEGQSTNLVWRSEDLLSWSKNGDVTRERQAGVYTKITAAGGTMGCYLAGITLVVGKTYTVSFWGYADAALAVKVGTEREAVGTVAALTTTPTRYSRTFTATQEIGTIVAYTAPGASGSFYVGGFQLEELPFASSYIPTNGAAVTRAADKAWLNVAGNLIPLSAIALEFNSIAPSSFYQAPNLTRYIVHTGDGTGITAYLGRFTTQFEDAGAAQGSTILPGRTVVVGGVSGGKAAIRSGAGLASGMAVKGFKQTEIYLCNSGVGPADRQAFGHVRNLRMYHRDLTADQYKAVA